MNFLWKAYFEWNVVKDLYVEFDEKLEKIYILYIKFEVQKNFPLYQVKSLLNFCGSINLLYYHTFAHKFNWGEKCFHRNWDSYAEWNRIR